MSRPVMTSEVKRMRELAAEGLSRNAIGKIVGRDCSTVKRHVGGLIDPKFVRGDKGRARVLVDAFDRAASSDREEVGRRLGYCSVPSFYNAVRRARIKLGLSPLSERCKIGDRDELRALAKSGAHATEIARQTGRSRTTIGRHCRDVLTMGKPGRPRATEARS